jgi:hypothetical protein
LWKRFRHRSLSPRASKGPPLVVTGLIMAFMAFGLALAHAVFFRPPATPALGDGVLRWQQAPLNDANKVGDAIGPSRVGGARGGEPLAPPGVLVWRGASGAAP